MSSAPRQDGAARPRHSRLARTRSKSARAAGARSPPRAKRAEAVGDDLLGLGNDLEDRRAQLEKRRPFRLLDAAQVLVDLLGGHAAQSMIRDLRQLGGVLGGDKKFVKSLAPDVLPAGRRRPRL